MRKIVVIMVILALLLSAVAVGIVYAIVEFDKSNHETWYDDTGSRKITTNDAVKIKEGMSFEEIVSILGKPARDVGSGAFVMEWDMESNQILRITFNPIPGSRNDGDLVAYLVRIVSLSED